MKHTANLNSPTPTLMVLVSGDLEVRIQENQKITVEIDNEEDLHLQQEGDTWRIEVDSDCILWVPENSELAVENVEGDLKIQGVRGAMSIQHASGDVEVRETGPVIIGDVSGDLDIDQVVGDFTARHISGDLKASGIQGQFLVGDVHGDCTFNQVTGDARVEHSSGDLDAEIIQGSLYCKQVSGDCTLQKIQGPVQVEHVSGDLLMFETGLVKIHTVSGDANLRKIQGNVAGQKVSGDAQAEGIQGGIVFDTIGGDLEIKGVTENIRSNVGGDVSLALDAPWNGDCLLQAGGDVACRIPEGIDALVDVASGSGDVVIRMPGRSAHLRSSTHHFTLGKGRHSIVLRAGGDIAVAVPGAIDAQIPDLNLHLDEDLSDLSERITREVNESIKGIPFGEISEQAMERARKATERHSERMQAARERIERRGLRMPGYFHSTIFGRTPTPPPPPAQPVEGAPGASPASEDRAADEPFETVTDEERLIILRMVQDKKISIEEAEQLLQALEGEADNSSE